MLEGSPNRSRNRNCELASASPSTNGYLRSRVSAFQVSSTLLKHAIPRSPAAQIISVYQNG